jgi:hypothetical protein
VDALEAERRFIVARSITLQNQADSLKARRTHGIASRAV